MTAPDFAKEARDLVSNIAWDNAHEWQVMFDYGEALARRMHAAGLAEGRATAAEITRGFHCGLCGMDGKIAEAILAAPPTRKEE